MGPDHLGRGRVRDAGRRSSWIKPTREVRQMANKLNPMPQLRALIVQGLERIEVDMDQCPKEWQYGIQYELKYSGYVPLEPAGNVITYIKKKKPSK